VCGRQLELEYFQNQHGVDIFLLSETFLRAGQDNDLRNTIAATQTDIGGGTAFLIRHGIVQSPLLIPGVIHLETTVIQVTLAGKLVIILALYLSPSQPLIGED
jgi:hypothetical protein